MFPLETPPYLASHTEARLHSEQAGEATDTSPHQDTESIREATVRPDQKVGDQSYRSSADLPVPQGGPMHTPGARSPQQSLKGLSHLEQTGCRDAVLAQAFLTPLLPPP